MVGIGFLGKRHSVVEGMEAFLDVFSRVLEVEHEGFLLARRGAVQAGERLHAGHTAELLVHNHRHQLGLIEARLELARHNEETVFIALEAIPGRGLGEAVHLGFRVFLAVLGVLHHIGESHQRLVGAVVDGTERSDVPEECVRRGASNVIAEHSPRVGAGLINGHAVKPMNDASG